MALRDQVGMNSEASGWEFPNAGINNFGSKEEAQAWADQVEKNGWDKVQSPLRYAMSQHQDWTMGQGPFGPAVFDPQGNFKIGQGKDMSNDGMGLMNPFFLVAGALGATLAGAAAGAGVETLAGEAVFNPATLSGAEAGAAGAAGTAAATAGTAAGAETLSGEQVFNPEQLSGPAETMAGEQVFTADQLSQMVNQSVASLGASTVDAATVPETTGGPSPTQVGTEPAESATQQAAKKMINGTEETLAGEQTFSPDQLSAPSEPAAPPSIADKVLKAIKENKEVAAAAAQVFGLGLAGAMKNAGDLKTAQLKANLDLQNKEKLLEFYRAFVAGGSTGGIGVNLGVAPSGSRGLLRLSGGPVYSASGALIGPRMGG